MSQLSSLEIQVVRASLSTRTDEEIAEILDRPVELVRSVINDMTGMAGQRQQEVKEKKSKEIQAAAVNRSVVRKKAEEGIKPLPVQGKNAARKKPDQQIRNQEHVMKLRRREREESSRFTTRDIDYSQMKSIKIDDKTTVFVGPWDDISEVKSRYQNIRKKQTNGTSDI